MIILVNGEERTVPEQSSVADLLSDLRHNPRFLAVEKNKVLIPRGRHAECLLEPGDRIEIVTLVGGG
ncbi:MAG: sulfur carrier protein ThiS [Planctomycetaceae bacterium]|nr:sulfur carrier protein ThiS [Planctomycetaceae bacterium]